MPYHVCGPDTSIVANEDRNNALLKYYSDTLDNGKIRTGNLAAGRLHVSWNMMEPNATEGHGITKREVWIKRLKDPIFLEPFMALIQSPSC